MNYQKLLARTIGVILVALLLIAYNSSQTTPTLAQTTAPSPTPSATISPENIPPNPSPRGYVSMAYNSKVDQVILFGGQTGYNKRPANFNGETWIYDVATNQWIQMKPLSEPAGRSAAELAYDIESDQVIMFGGATASNWGLDETWAYNYNTNTWKEMAKGPAKHLGARIAYDTESDRVVLFGGYDLAHLLNDTWVYDYNSDTWTEMKPSINPLPRNYHTMTYNSKADRVIMWGGDDEKKGDESIWAYDLNTNTWQEIKPGTEPHPSYRDYGAMIYDVKSDRIILFGGLSGGSDETWAYDYNTNTWTELKPITVPGKLSRHTMVYSTIAEQTILFGGQVGYVQFDYTDKTWTYNLKSNTWIQVMPLP